MFKLLSSKGRNPHSRVYSKTPKLHKSTCRKMSIEFCTFKNEKFRKMLRVWLELYLLKISIFKIKINFNISAQ